MQGTCDSTQSLRVAPQLGWEISDSPLHHAHSHPTVRADSGQCFLVHSQASIRSLSVRLGPTNRICVFISNLGRPWSRCGIYTSALGWWRGCNNRVTVGLFLIPERCWGHLCVFSPGRQCHSPAPGSFQTGFVLRRLLRFHF